MHHLRTMEDGLIEHSRARLKEDTIAEERVRPTNEMKIKIDSSDLKLFNKKSYDEVAFLNVDGSKCDKNLDLGTGSIFEVTVYWKSYAKENCNMYGTKVMTNLDKPSIIHQIFKRLTGLVG